MDHFQNTRSDIFIFRKRAVFHKSQNSAFGFPCPALGLTPGLPLLLSLQLLLSALRMTPFSTVGPVARCKSWIQPYSPQLHWCCCATFLPVLSSGSETSWPIELTAFRNELCLVSWLFTFLLHQTIWAAAGAAWLALGKRQHSPPEQEPFHRGWTPAVIGCEASPCTKQVWLAVQPGLPSASSDRWAHSEPFWPWLRLLGPHAFHWGTTGCPLKSHLRFTLKTKDRNQLLFSLQVHQVTC